MPPPEYELFRYRLLPAEVAARQGVVERYRRRWGPLIETYASQVAIPPALLYTVVAYENPWLDPRRLGPATPSGRAVGLGQLMEIHARREPTGRVRPVPLDLTDPAQNLWAAAQFLGHLWRQYAQDPVKTLLGYLAGEPKLERSIAERGPSDWWSWWRPSVRREIARRFQFLRHLLGG